MKIYFAGSIRGGRRDRDLYRRMIQHLKRNHTVLSEHIGDMTLQKVTTDEEIYRQDTAWLKECDMVIAECTNPSLGVGYELAYAQTLGKRVHIFYDASRTGLSAMLTGAGYYIIHPYRQEEEVYPVLDDILRENSADLRRISPQHAPRVAL